MQKFAGIFNRFMFLSGFFGINLLLLLMTGCQSQPTSASIKNAVAAPSLVQTAQVASGQTLFENNCAGCHAGGQNAINPAKPVQGSRYLKDTAAFIRFLRHPSGSMPPFDSTTLPDADTKNLLTYLQYQWPPVR